MEQPIPSQPTYRALVAQHTSHWRIGDNSYHLRGYEHMAKAATPEGNPLQVWARRDMTSQSLQDTHLNGPPQRCIQHRRVLLYPSGQTIWDAPYDASERHSFPSRTDMVTELWYQADPPQQQQQHSASLVNTLEGIQLKEPCSDGSDEIRMPFACHQALKAYRKTDDFCGDGESSDSDIPCDDMTLGSQGVKTPLTKSSGGMLEKARARQEQKALDKEIPWQSIMALPPEDLAKYVESARAEETSWQQFSSVVPLTQKGRPSLGGWRPSLGGWRPSLGGWRPSLGGWRPSLGGWRPSLGGWRPSLGGWRPSLGGWLEAIARRLEAIARRFGRWPGCMLHSLE